MATTTQFAITMMILIGGIIYVTAMYLYRRISAGEQFSAEKYALTFGYVALLALAAYVTTGFIPDFGQILITVEQGIPEGAALLTLLTSFVLGLLQKLFQWQSGKPKPIPIPVPEPVNAPTVIPPQTPLPERPYKCSEATRQWATFDATPENKVKILAQIDAAEVQKLYRYQVSFDGGFYVIEGGQIVSSAGNPSGKGGAS